MKRIFSWVRNAINNLMLWGALVLGTVGGLAATGTFIVSVVSFIVRLGPWWAPYPLAAVGALCVFGDIGKNGIPERFAVYIPMAWPSVLLAIPEKALLHKLLTGWITQLNHWLDKNLGAWIGSTGTHAVMTIVATTCIASGIFVMERYAPKKGGAAAGSPIGTPVATRRAR